MNAYHVLAKVITSAPDSVSSDQRHFFVKAACSSKAVALAEMRVHISEGSDVQYTVKEATDRGSTGMEAGEEIYSL